MPVAGLFVTTWRNVRAHTTDTPSHHYTKNHQKNPNALFLYRYPYSLAVAFAL